LIDETQSAKELMRYATLPVKNLEI